MSSDHPTWPDNLRHKEKTLARLKSMAQSAAAIAAVLSAALATAWSFLGSFSTDTERRAAFEDHERSAAAHEPLRARIERLEQTELAVMEKLTQTLEADVALGERLVSVLAADREPSRAHKAEAARVCREEYTRLIRRGYKVEDAMLEALRGQRR